MANLQGFFQEFNASKFVVFTSLLLFSLLFTLQLDQVIDWSWWAIFFPLWIWKTVVILGAGVGSYIWWKRPLSRVISEEYVQYKAMLISLAVHLLLLMFELLSADNLEYHRHMWILVFVPLIFVSMISIGISVWSVRHDRSFELELFCAVNILQFVFLALKLDGIIIWSWEITFIPFWIVLCVSLVGVLYTIIFAGILLRMPDVNSDQRRSSTHSALGYSFLVVPLLVFLVLLTNKLDNTLKISYFAATTPLFLTFVTLIITSFGTRGGNQYWFGLRKPPCQFLFGVCPCLQLFGNVSYSLQNMGNIERNNNSERQSSEPDGNLFPGKKKNMKQETLGVPVVTLEMPD